MARGVDRLSDWAIVEVAHSEELRLHLRCTNDVARQIERRLTGAIERRLPYRADDQGEWTHRYDLRRRPDEGESAFLEMLSQVLTLRLGDEPLVAIAIDYYKDPTSNSDPAMWTNTPTGDLVHRGKYEGSDDAGRQLARTIARTVQNHPDLNETDLIVAVPSHSGRRFSERLATAVGKALGRPVIIVGDDRSEPVKDTEASSRGIPTFTGEFGAVDGNAVLIIDDVTRTGESLKALAATLKAAGATSVSIVVGVRTMRN